MERLGYFLDQRRSRKSEVSETEKRHFIERWLRRELKEELIYCEAAGQSGVTVRVSSAVLAQEVYVREGDLQEALQESGGGDFRNLRVGIGW